MSAEGDAGIDAPEGRVTIDPASQHLSHHMRMVSVNDRHEVAVLKDFGEIKPYWLGQVGCNLTKRDDNEQYSPSSLPRKS